MVTAYLLTGTAVTPLYGKLVRHPRPARDDAHRRSAFSSLGSVACALAPQHDRAGAGARLAGARRRRADGAGADHHRRHRVAARARPLPGLYRRGVRAVLGRRAGARRLSDRASRLVADLLDQPAARPCRARHDLERAQARAVSSAQAQARCHRRAADDVGGGGAAAGAVLGRPAFRWISPQIGVLLLASAMLWGLFALAAGVDAPSRSCRSRCSAIRWCAARRSPAPATWARWSA